MAENNGEKNESLFNQTEKTKEDEQVSSYGIRVTNLNPQTTDKQWKILH